MVCATSSDGRWDESGVDDEQNRGWHRDSVNMQLTPTGEVDGVIGEIKRRERDASDRGAVGHGMRDDN